jgi:hypothetical protein
MGRMPEEACAPFFFVKVVIRAAEANRRIIHDIIMTKQRLYLYLAPKRGYSQ